VCCNVATRQRTGLDPIRDDIDGQTLILTGQVIANYQDNNTLDMGSCSTRGAILIDVSSAQAK
jgi:hypothetical protein